MMARALQVVVLLSVSAPVFAANGYGGSSACIPGYDTDCKGGNPAPTPAPPAPPAPVVTPQTAAPTEEPEPVQPAPTPEVVGTTHQGCHYEPDPNCRFPFKYKGNWFSTCIGQDHFASNWCSTDHHYNGNWVHCKKVCTKDQHTGQIIAGVVGGGAAAAAAGLIIGAVVEAKKTTTTAEPEVAPKAAATLPPGVEVVSYPIPHVAPDDSRLYKSGEKVSAAGVASSTWGPAFVLFGVFSMFVLLASIGVYRRSKKQAQKPADAAESNDDVETPAPQSAQVDQVPLLEENLS